MTLCKIDSYMSIYIYIYSYACSWWLYPKTSYSKVFHERPHFRHLIYVSCINRQTTDLHSCTIFSNIWCSTIFARKVFLFIYVFWCQTSWLVTICYDLYVFFGKKMQDIMIWCFSYIYIYLLKTIIAFCFKKLYIYTYIHHSYIYIYMYVYIYTYIYIYIWILFVTFLSSFY